jgi:hypothetical protein
MEMYNDEKYRLSRRTKINIFMKMLWPIVTRIALVFAVLFGLQFLIHYYVLVGVGIVAGGFMLKISDDKPLAWGVLIGSILFGVFAYLYGTV